jgi:hypothetical protein
MTGVVGYRRRGGGGARSKEGAGEGQGQETPDNMDRQLEALDNWDVIKSMFKLKNHDPKDHDLALEWAGAVLERDAGTQGIQSKGIGNLSAETRYIMDKRFQMMWGDKIYHFAEFNDRSLEEAYQCDISLRLQRRCLASMVLHVTGLSTLHPTPYTLHPTPYTLHPTPYTLHPTPYTLHPTPQLGFCGRPRHRPVHSKP